MERVAVVGPVGAGKSTLSRELAGITMLPVVNLDELYWRDGPVPTDTEWELKHAALIAADRWIIDGDYRATAAGRFERADTVVWVDPGPWRCTVRILRRHRSGYPAPLADCLRWTWRYRAHGRRETAALLAALDHEVTIARVRNRRDHRRLLERVAAQ